LLSYKLGVKFNWEQSDGKNIPENELDLILTARLKWSVFLVKVEKLLPKI